MRKYTKNLVLIIIPLCAPLMFAGAATANDSLGSAEIKNLRFLSQAILKSRIQERRAIKKEIEPKRESLRIFQNELQRLEQQMIKMMFDTSLKVNVVNAASITETELIKTENKAIVVKPAMEKRALNVKRLTKDKFNATIDILKKNRDALEKENGLPKFWQERTTTDHRKQRIIDEVIAVESELISMSRAEKINVRKLKGLRERLQLKKREIFIEKIDPTIMTITKHRN